jgi:hypothetical protein
MRIPGHRYKRGFVKSLSEQAALIINRRIIGAPHGGHFSFLKNSESRIKKSCGHMSVLNTIKKTKKANTVLIVGVMRIIDNSCNAANRLSVSIGNEWKDFSMLF